MCKEMQNGLPSKGQGQCIRKTGAFYIWMLLLTGFVIVVSGAETRSEEGGFVLWDLFPQETAQDALAEAYGRALVKEFASILHESADPTCLTEKGIGRAQLEQTATSLLTRYGQKVVDNLFESIDPMLARHEFIRRSGEGAPSEMRQLSTDSLVQTYWEAGRRAERVHVADYIVYQFDVYLGVYQLRLKRQISPALTGNAALLALNKAAKDTASPEALLRSNEPHQKLRRFIKLREDWDQALRVAIMLAHTPTFRQFGGIEEELQASCVNVK